MVNSYTSSIFFYSMVIPCYTIPIPTILCYICTCLSVSIHEHTYRCTSKLICCNLFFFRAHGCPWLHVEKDWHIHFTGVGSWVSILQREKIHTAAAKVARSAHCKERLVFMQGYLEGQPWQIVFWQGPVGQFWKEGYLLQVVEIDVISLPMEQLPHKWLWGVSIEANSKYHLVGIGQKPAHHLQHCPVCLQRSMYTIASKRMIHGHGSHGEGCLAHGTRVIHQEF